MLLFYSESKDDLAQNLIRLLEKRAGKNRVKPYHSLGDLLKRLRRPRGELQMGVFVIGNDQEMDNIISIREFLSDLRLVFVLTQTKKSCIDKAHTLGPRYVAFADREMESLGAVIEKMTRNMDMAKKQTRDKAS